MPVPTENVLGPVGKGLKVALTVLDFGRTTFGACCTGAAKACLAQALRHTRSRRQFGRTLAEFELVQKKLAHMAAGTYAMEAMASVTAGLIDRGEDDYMLETAMLKVHSTETLWTIVNDAFQMHGGTAYFTDRPLERMLRDARINQIGEGANEVLTSFIALVGMRDPGERLRDVRNALHRPWSEAGKICRFAAEELVRRWHWPRVAVRSARLTSYANSMGRLIPAVFFGHSRRIDLTPGGTHRTSTRSGANRSGRDGDLRVGLCTEPVGRQTPGGSSSLQRIWTRRRGCSTFVAHF